MSIWAINHAAKTNGRNALMVCDNASHTPIAEVKMPYIPNGTVKPTPDAEGQKKHAALIAAAPDLLNALKGMLDLMENWHHLEGTPRMTEQFGEGRKAIAKAEGGAA